MKLEKAMDISEGAKKRAVPVSALDPQKIIETVAFLAIDSAAGFLQGKEIDIKAVENIYAEMKKAIEAKTGSFVSTAFIGNILDQIESSNSKKAKSDPDEVKRKKLLEIVEKIREAKKISRPEKEEEKGRLYDFGKIFSSPLTKAELIQEVDSLKTRAIEFTGSIAESMGPVDERKEAELKKLTYDKITAVIRMWEEKRSEEGGNFDQEIDDKIDELKAYKDFLEHYGHAIRYEHEPDPEMSLGIDPNEREEAKPDEDVDPWHYQE